MKRIALIFLMVVVFSGTAFGASLSLRATWTANTEPDMKEYKLYRTDGTRSLVGTVAHPNTAYTFSVTIPDGSAGTLTFVLTAVDTNNNQSADSAIASYSYNLDAAPPTAPKSFSVVKQ